MPDPDLTALVRNRTLSPEMAATLAAAAEEQRSLLFVAIPRMAGKTTTMRAALEYAPAGTLLHALSEEHGPSLGIPAEPDGGYLVMSEIAQTPFPDYLWGEPVRQVFSAVERGFALATALHAGGIEEAFEVITGANAVPDEDAGRIDLVVYIRSLGPDWRNPQRRVVATMHEVDGVAGGRPQSRLLHHWIEDQDRFERAEPSGSIGSRGADIERHVRQFRQAATD